MLGQFGCRIRRPVCALVKPAELVMGRGMLGLKLNHGFKLLDGFVQVSEAFLCQAELKIQSGYGWIDLLRFLERLDRLLDLV